MKLIHCLLALVALTALAAWLPGADPDWPQYRQNPFVIPLEVPPIPSEDESAGGIIAADLDGDRRPDYLVTVPGHVAAYRNDGRKLWVHRVPVQVGGSSESTGLPGHHGPGVQAGDVDGDGRSEVCHLTRDGHLQVVDGATGKEEMKVALSAPEGAERWEHAVIASFRGKGKVDLLLQATNRKGYRMGRYLAAFPFEELLQKKSAARALWRRDDFLACAHNGARIADLDGDGRDEVLGGTIVSAGGEILHRIPLRGHIDSIFVEDVRPDIPGLEVVALEEGGGNRVFLFNQKDDLWITHHRNQEPQNAGVGDLDPSREGLEVWCRSRYDRHQKPFVFDSRGKLIADYKMDDVAPASWTDKGVEVIHKIDWTGGEGKLLAAKERHRSGDVGIFNGLTGKFVARYKEKADRLYVADVSGDWREEIVVLSGNELHIYHNPEANPRPGRPRLWTIPHYRRSKMTYNYYSP